MTGKNVIAWPPSKANGVLNTLFSATSQYWKHGRPPFLINKPGTDHYEKTIPDLNRRQSAQAFWLA